MPSVATKLSPSQAKAEADLDDLLAEHYHDPLGFVRVMWPWGEAGTPLADEPGPDSWQTECLEDIGRRCLANAFDGQHAVPALRKAISKGHGVGGSVMIAWLTTWIMATRPHAQGTVTANTSTQLETKTWPTITRWLKLSVVGHRFTINTARMYHTEHRESWFCSAQTCREENSEAFAGQHAKDSSSFYMFDEDSSVPDVIHTVAEGGLTDGEPFIVLSGNATRTTGQFYRACFGTERHRWHPTIVDSRTSRFTNKETIQEWLELYGEDSDFFRVRVRGLPPKASDAQFIDQTRVIEAQQRQVVVLPDEPLIAGADLAWGGGDDNVIRFRRGNDARSIPAIRVKGEFTRDPAVLTTRLADILTRTYDGRRVEMLFLDSAGIAGPIGNRLRQMGHQNVIEVNFGSDSPDPQCRFFRDFIWQQGKQWLLTGAIDGPDTDSGRQLEADLLGPGIRPDTQQRVWLEDKKTMKQRGLDSPDDADALFLTFAAPVGSVVQSNAPPPIPMGPNAWSY